MHLLLSPLILMPAVSASTLGGGFRSLDQSPYSYSCIDTIQINPLYDQNSRVQERILILPTS